MKRHFCILFCLALLGCSQQGTKRPADLIDESRMVRILADIHMAEAQVESTVSYPDTALMVFSKLQQDIFQKHGITEEEFRKTYNFYSENIPEMDKLYETVVDTLIAREANYVIRENPEAELPADTLDAASDTVDFRLRRKVIKRPGGFKYDTESGQE